MWEKNQFLQSVVSFQYFHSCETRWEEEIKKPKPNTHRWGKNELRCKHMTLKEQMEKNAAALYLPLNLTITYD